VDELGGAVVVIGIVGQGKVVLFGMLPGVKADRTDKDGYEHDIAEGEELKLLLNAVDWLSSE